MNHLRLAFRPFLPVDRRLLRMFAIGAVLLACCPFAAPLAAEEYRESFDAGDATWQTEFDRNRVRLLAQRRQQHLFSEGTGAELLQFQFQANGGEVRLTHSLPPAVVIEELKATVSVRATQPGLTLQLHVVLPDQVDPETKGSVGMWLAGDRLTTPGQWQELTCRTTEKLLQDELRRLRYRLNRPEISLRGAFVDKIALQAAFGSNAVEVLVDDLQLSPLVSVSNQNAVVAISDSRVEPESPCEFRLNRLRVEGQPFFPRIAPYHDEDVSAFANMGFNVAWVQDYRDEDLLNALKSVNVWSTATPPRATDGEGAVLGARQAGLPPFQSDTQQILFWNLGPRISPTALEEVSGWISQIHAADASYARPMMADVTGAERPFSRHVEMLSSSRHITHTAVPYHAYRGWLETHRSAAWPGAFFWTWIQTEPSAAAQPQRMAAGRRPLVIEPEQIRTQVYAALSAGCRGIGFWKTTKLDGSTPEQQEVQLAITQLNYELDLLGPFLAKGEAAIPLPFGVEENKPGSDGRRTLPGHYDYDLEGPVAPTSPFAPQERPKGKLEAGVIKSDKGILLLPVWYGEGSQFCPPPMAANDVTIVVPGVDETASAWILSTTGVRSLRRERVAGGVKIIVPKLDQTAAILFTSDQATIASLYPVIGRMAGPSAAASVALAKLKRDRVLAVHQELAALGHQQADQPAMVAKANALISRADASLSRNDHSAQKDAADDAMQMLRVLQRTHWDDAVRRLSSPLTSPHAISFSTLPDHYRLISAVGQSAMSPGSEANILPRGDFENGEQMFDAGWKQTPGLSANLLRASACVTNSTPQEGRYCLQLLVMAPPGREAPLILDDAPLTVTSPAVPVRAGEIYHISGWVRIASPIPESSDGVTLHDSILGPSGGLRWTKTSGWERFQLLREVQQDGMLMLTATLHGIGDVSFDDLRIVPHSPQGPVAEERPITAPTNRFSELIEGLPNLPIRR